MALALWLLGMGVERTLVERGLGAAVVDALLACGALVCSGANAGLLCAPVQVFPLALERRESEAPPLLVATDWDLESLLPNQIRVMAVGLDSLELAHSAPRHVRHARVLDVCCGSGVP